MTTYTKNLSEPWFSLIKLGLKKVEGRLNKGDFSKMQKDDYIIFENNDFNFVRRIKVKIKYTSHYNTFMRYLRGERLERCLPGIDTFDEGAKIYYKYYSKKDEDIYKVVAFRMEVVNL